STWFDFFFFSSRRRHTRSKRDWSSDVCSSDLGGKQLQVKDYDSLAEPDIPSGTSRTWVYPYEIPEEGTGIQVRASLTNPGEANSGPVGAFFTGTYRNN